MLAMDLMFVADVVKIGSAVEYHKWNLESIKHEDFEEIWEHLSRGIKAGAYKPIPQHCFHSDEIQKAIGDLKSMKGYHSKIVIKVKNLPTLYYKPVGMRGYE